MVTFPDQMEELTMQSKASTVNEYLAQLPPDRRAALEAVRAVILANLDKDYAEGMQYGMIGYAVPHSVFPPGYHCDPRQPLPFAGLASQKNHMSLYIMSAYGDGPERERFLQEWRKTGKKLDMGQACIRFKRVEDLALDVIGKAIKRMPARAYVEQYQRALAASGRPVGQAAKKATKKTAKKTTKKATTKATKKSTKR